MSARQTTDLRRGRRDALLAQSFGGGPSVVDQQRRAGSEFRDVGSRVEDGCRDFFASAQSTHGMQRSQPVPLVRFFAHNPVDHLSVGDTRDSLSALLSDSPVA